MKIIDAPKQPSPPTPPSPTPNHPSARALRRTEYSCATCVMCGYMHIILSHNICTPSTDTHMGVLHIYTILPCWMGVCVCVSAARAMRGEGASHAGSRACSRRTGGGGNGATLSERTTRRRKASSSSAHGLVCADNLPQSTLPPQKRNAM